VTVNFPDCKDCKFFEPSESEKFPAGECRRYAPHPGRERQDEDGHVDPLYRLWPKVSAGDWCGEFQAQG